MSFSPGLLAFSPETARVTAKVLFQAWILLRMCYLYWAPVPVPTDDKGPRGNRSYITINRESRGQMNVWINPKGSRREAARTVSWCVVNLDLLHNLPVLHELIIDVVLTLQCAGSPSSGGEEKGEKEREPVVDSPCAAAGFCVFVSVIYLWHW